MDLQTCDHDKCIMTHLSSDYKPQMDVCYMCKGLMNEVGMLKNCDHVSCADCLREVRKNNKCIKCPLCKVISYTAVYTKSIFRDKEKEMLFRKHVNCLFGGDPVVTKHLDKLNSEWLAMVEMIASSESHGHFRSSLHVEGYSKTMDMEALHVSNNYATFCSRKNEADHRVVVYCKIPNCLCLRVVLGYEPLFGRDHEDDYADEAIHYFNEQLKASWEAIPYIFRESTETCTLGRRFDRMYCAFKFRLLKFCPFKRLWKDVPDGLPTPMKDQLGSIRLQNFKFDWRDIEKMLEGKFDFAGEVEKGVFPLLHD